jgi:hypothetical protein
MYGRQCPIKLWLRLRVNHRLTFIYITRFSRRRLKHYELKGASANLHPEGIEDKFAVP